MRLQQELKMQIESEPTELAKITERVGTIEVEKEGLLMGEIWEE